MRRRGGGAAYGAQSSALPVGVSGSDSACAAVHADELAVGEGFGPNTRAHHRGDAVLPCDDRRVRARTSGVHDHRGGTLKQSRPGWIRIGADKYVAAGEPVELGGLADHSDGPGRGAAAGRRAGDEGVALLAPGEDCERVDQWHPGQFLTTRGPGAYGGTQLLGFNNGARFVDLLEFLKP